MKKKQSVVFLTALFAVLVFLMIAAIAVLFIIPDYDSRASDLCSFVTSVFPLISGISFFVLGFIIIDVYRKPKVKSKSNSPEDRDDALYRYLTSESGNIYQGDVKNLK